MTTEGAQLYHCLPIPDGDRKDIFDSQAISMAMIHNVFIRGFNSLLYYSGEVQPGTKQLKSFISYASEICVGVHHHHRGEETMFFPFIEEKLGAGRMSENVAAHEAFSKPFEAFEELVKKLMSNPELWDAKVFRDSIHSFMPVLREHLAQELTTLDAAELRKYITAKDFEEYEKKFLSEIKKTVSFSRTFQAVYVNGDSVNGDWFPPFPAPLIFLTKYGLYWINSDMWEFGSCDKHMRVKAPFAPYEPPAKVQH